MLEKKTTPVVTGVEEIDDILATPEPEWIRKMREKSEELAREDAKNAPKPEKADISTILNIPQKG